MGEGPALRGRRLDHHHGRCDLTSSSAPCGRVGNSPAAEAERVGQELAYPRWRPGAPACMPRRSEQHRAIPPIRAYGGLPVVPPDCRYRAGRGHRRDRCHRAVRPGRRKLLCRPRRPDRRRVHCHNPPRAATPRTTGRRRRTLRRQALVGPGPRHASEVRSGLLRWAADQGLDIERPHAGQAGRRPPIGGWRVSTEQHGLQPQSAWKHLRGSFPFRHGRDNYAGGYVVRP